MERQEASAKAALALKLLLELYDARHEIWKQVENPKEAWLVRYFAIQDAIAQVRRLGSMLSDWRAEDYYPQVIYSPPADPEQLPPGCRQLTIAGALAGDDRLGG